MYALDIAEGATGEEDIEDVTGDAPEGPGDGDGSADGSASGGAGTMVVM